MFQYLRVFQLCEHKQVESRKLLQELLINCTTYYIHIHFNVVYQATQEELKVAYRRLCMLYHPDKHRDPELKRQAEQLFNLVHEAYEGKKSS